MSTRRTGTAVQAHALRAAAAFIEQAGMPGLQVTACGDGSIVIRVPAAAGPPPPGPQRSHRSPPPSAATAPHRHRLRRLRLDHLRRGHRRAPRPGHHPHRRQGAQHP